MKLQQLPVAAQKGTEMNFSRIFRLLIFAAIVAAFSTASFAGVFISVNFGPPALPVYVQPPCPAPGYVWTPGYWAYGPDGYYWVPGTWVVAPVGLLWTPGYWGWGDGAYLWHAGYWGPHVGFYGGINYGYGYPGSGFEGGEWRGNNYYYNRNVTNVNVTNVTNVYNKTVIVNNTTNINRVSYNGGTGGTTSVPTPSERAFARETHTPATSVQTQHEQMAASNPQLRASVNQGRPAIAATAKPAQFSGAGVVQAKAAGAPYHAPAAQPRTNAAPAPAANTRNNVPRPPSASGESMRPGNVNGSEPRPQANVRPENGSTMSAAPRPGNNSVPRPPSASQPSSQSNEGYTSSRSQGYNSVPHPSNSNYTPQPAQPRSNQSYGQPRSPESGSPQASRPPSSPRPEYKRAEG